MVSGNALPDGCRICTCLPERYPARCPEASIKILAHGQVRRVEDEPAVPVSKGLVKFFGDLLPCLAVDGVEEQVPLEWTTCNFGGQCPWFSAPGLGVAGG